MQEDDYQGLIEIAAFMLAKYSSEASDRQQLLI